MVRWQCSLLAMRLADPSRPLGIRTNGSPSGSEEVPVCETTTNFVEQHRRRGTYASVARGRSALEHCLGTRPNLLTKSIRVVQDTLLGRMLLLSGGGSSKDAASKRSEQLAAFP